MAQLRASVIKNDGAAKANIELGKLVSCKYTKAQGTITKICGRKWLKIAWAHGCVFDEHIDDLIIIKSNKERKSNV